MKEYGPKVMHRGARTVNMGRIIFTSKYRFENFWLPHLKTYFARAGLRNAAYMHDFRAILLPLHVNE